MAERIMIVEDNEDAQRYLGYSLRARGYEIVLAATAGQALEKVETMRPDLIILDVMLPDMDGVELCRQLRSRETASRLPIIIVSARTDVTDKVRGLQAGADDYVSKPVDLGELAARVAAHLERSRQQTSATPAAHGKTAAFLGVKGGVGTTSLVLSVAAALGRHGHSVIAVELRPWVGTFAGQMQLAMPGTLVELLQRPAGEVNRTALDHVVANTEFGFKVLLGPQQTEAASALTADHAGAIVEGLARMADYVLIDLPAGASEGNQAALRVSNGVVLVMEPESLCLWCGKATIQLLKSWDVRSSRTGVVVVRRTPLTAPLEPGAIRTELGVDVLGSVPHALEAFHRALKAQSPIVGTSPDNPAGNAIADITTRLKVLVS